MYLARLISVLEAIAAAGRPIGVAEIQATTGLPRPTCYRLVQDLADQDLITAGPERGRYSLAQRLRRMALMGQSDDELRLAAAPILQDAANQNAAAFFLSRLRGTAVEIIQVETPKNGGVSYVHPGLGRRPLHACSCSKAIAAFADEAFQGQVIKGRLKSYTPKTETDGERLRAEFETIRARGYAECVEEIEVGISSVAAPVLIDGLGAPFSLGATGSLRSFTPRRRRELGQTLIALCDRLGRRLSLAEKPAPAAPVQA